MTPLERYQYLTEYWRSKIIEYEDRLKLAERICDVYAQKVEELKASK